MITIEEAMTANDVFGPVLGDPTSWVSWRAILKAAFAEPLSADERAIFDRVAGGREPPRSRVRELWCVVGRRGGKSRMAGMVSAYTAGFLSEHVPLAPGEEGLIISVAPSVKQAGRVHKYARGFIFGCDDIADTVEGETQTEIRLAGNIVLTTKAADADTVRGDTVIAAVFEEVAFWAGENSANPDTEIFNAVAPALLTTNGIIIGISSPYARRGLLWDRYRRYFGKDDPGVLVIMATTWDLNPNITRDHPLIAARYEEDPVAAAAEHGEGWREDVEAWVSREAVEACVSRGVTERPPIAGVTYRAFVDPSGGSRDSFTLSIGHVEAGRAVVDLVREVRPPFSPAGVVADFAGDLKGYGVSTVEGDRYGGEWPRERFAEQGIAYVVAGKAKSELYGDLLAAINSGRVDFLDDDRLVNQLVALERRTARGGRSTVDHAPGAFDDRANAVAGLVAMLDVRAGEYPFYVEGFASSAETAGGLPAHMLAAPASGPAFDPWRDLPGGDGESW